MGNKKRTNRRYTKRRQHVTNRVRVSPKFHHAVSALKRMKMNQRRQALKNANNRFVSDLSKVMGKLRRLPRDALPPMSPQMRRSIYVRRRSLRSFVSPKTSMKKKRMMIKQKGGIFPALIPLICAGIAAAGSVGSAAVGAAIAR